MDDQSTSEIRLLADIDQLRDQFPQTQDLYREVCTLLFFQYGMTPTANRLYQLVRKGSMTAPAEALNKFWDDLREKSRVRIEHPDLPDALKAAAGELTAVLWASARTLAQESGADRHQAAWTQGVGALGLPAAGALADIAAIEAGAELDRLHAELDGLKAERDRLQAERERSAQALQSALQRCAELEQTLAASRAELAEATAQQAQPVPKTRTPRARKSSEPPAPAAAIE